MPQKKSGDEKDSGNKKNCEVPWGHTQSEMDNTGKVSSGLKKTSMEDEFAKVDLREDVLI